MSLVRDVLSASNVRTTSRRDAYEFRFEGGIARARARTADMKVTCNGGSPKIASMSVVHVAQKDPIIR